VLARPGLDRLRDAVKGREIDRVLVTTPDRLARNPAASSSSWTAR
jgi:site-specific DNA recombinase